MGLEAWKFFKKSNSKGTTTCTKCKKVLSYKGSTTSALLRHLQTKHNINLKQGHDDKETTGENSSVVEVEPQGPMERYLKKETMATIVAKLVAMDGFSIHSISHSCFITNSFSMRGFSLPKNH